MKIIVFIVSILLASNCYAALWHYTDKATGEERGIQYADKPIDNPLWNVEEINEAQKKDIIDKQVKERDKKQEEMEKQKDIKKKNCSTKLKALGLVKDDISVILGDKYGD